MIHGSGWLGFTHKSLHPNLHLDDYTPHSAFNAARSVARSRCGANNSMKS